MEILLGLLAVVVLGGILYFNRNKVVDAKKDSTVNVEDAKPAVEVAVETAPVPEANVSVPSETAEGAEPAKKATKPKAPKKPAAMKTGAKSKSKKPTMTVVK